MVCDFGPKGEARTFELCVLSGPYIQEVILPLVIVILGFLTIPWLGLQDTEQRTPLVPKANLRHRGRVHHQVLIFRKLSYP